MLQLCIAQRGSGAAEPNSGASSWSPVCSPATQMGWRTTIKSLLCEPIRSQHLLLLIGTKGLEGCLFTQNLIGNLDLARRVKKCKRARFSCAYQQYTPLTHVLSGAVLQYLECRETKNSAGEVQQACFFFFKLIY